MHVTLDIPRNADGWARYGPEEFVSEMVSDHVEEIPRTGEPMRVQFADVSRFTTGPDVLGLSLPAGGYTMPQTEVVSLRSAADAIECEIVIPGGTGVSNFCDAVEYADTGNSPGAVRLREVSQIDTWETGTGLSGMAVSFSDRSGYTVPGWVREARDTTAEYIDGFQETERSEHP